MKVFKAVSMSCLN